MSFAPLSSDDTPPEGFLADNDGDDSFAALDSMAPHSFSNYTQQQQQMQQATMSTTSNNAFAQPTGSSSGNASVGSFGSSESGRIGEGRDGAGFSGVSESLFDRIRARTAEQQQMQKASQVTLPPPSMPHQHHHQQQQQQPSQSSQEQACELIVELERENNSFDAAVIGASTGAPSNQPPPNETTYSFSGPSDYSNAIQAGAPHIPTYGPSRNDVRYSSANQQQQHHQYPSSIQDKASMAFTATSETMKSLWDKGLTGVETIFATAQSKMGGGEGVGTGSGYNNNFLLREDSLEYGHATGGGGGGATATMPQPNEAAASSTNNAVSGQAYSMLSYGKTFCEDVYAFFMQLPPWGKGIVVAVLLWVLYVFKG
eukprot:g12759.t1 g12759   contig7:56921-58033(-)